MRISLSAMMSECNVCLSLTLRRVRRRDSSSRLFTLFGQSISYTTTNTVHSNYTVLLLCVELSSKRPQVSAMVKIETTIGKTYRCKVRFGNYTSPRVEAQFHLADLSVHIFHEPESLIDIIVIVM